MIRARFFKTDGGYCGFSISGHAEYASKGRDIVCAGVSSAVQMAVNTITEIIGAGAFVKNADGEILLRLCRDSSGKAEIAMDVIAGLRLHLLLLSEKYKRSICICDLEV